MELYIFDSIATSINQLIFFNKFKQQKNYFHLIKNLFHCVYSLLEFTHEKSSLFFYKSIIQWSNNKKRKCFIMEKKNLKKITKKPTKNFSHWKSIQCFYGQVASISHQIDEMKRKKTFLQIKKFFN